jgi:pimeloyl-ACP methyl ester carboxylesterase
MTSFVTSADLTRIAYDRTGDGPEVVLVSGLLCDRVRMREHAAQLSAQFTVINYDRRGRGDSGDRAPYAVAREVEDIGALIAASGGEAMMYGHSSGAALALNAAASGLPVTRLVLHEPPYGGDDEESKRSTRELARNIRAAIASDRREHAIRLFFKAGGMPAEIVDGIANDPDILAMAPTMVHDLEVMGDFDRGGTIPVHLVTAIQVPTLVIHGDASPDFFRVTAARIAALLPDGTQAVLKDQDHDAPAEVVAPVVAEFLGRVGSSSAH